MRFPRTESILCVALLFSVAAIALYHANPRVLVIEPGEDWTSIVYDGPEGLNEGAVQESSADAFQFSYTFAPSKKRRSAAIQIQPRGMHNVQNAEKKEAAVANPFGNLQWMERVRLTAHVEEKQQQFYRLQFYNQVDGMQAQDGKPVFKYNEAYVSISDKPQTYEITRENFFVPGWWREKYKAPIHEGIPTFERLQWLAFATGHLADGESFGRLTISKIEIVGHWLPHGTFYQGLAIMWLLLVTGVVVAEMIRLRQKLNLACIEQSSLTSKNNLLAEQACKDPLTGLLNRRGIQPYLELAPDAVNQGGFSRTVILFDIDDFKQVNDEQGHAFGDQILIDIATVASAVLTAEQPICRWGGEEFLVICRVGVDKATAIANRLRLAFIETAAVTCSFGVYELSKNENIDEAISKADVALYQAKSNGKNQTHVFTVPPKDSGFLKDGSAQSPQTVDVS